MICINNEVYIESKNELQEFIDLLRGEGYDNQSNSIITCLEQYFTEVWRKSNALEREIKKRLNSKLFIVAYMNFNITDNFSEIQVELFSKDDVKIGKKEQIIFENLSKMYFGNIVLLRDRLSNL